jgi:hypothetical protein
VSKGFLTLCYVKLRAGQPSDNRCIVGRYKDTQSGIEGPYLAFWSLIFQCQAFSEVCPAFFSALFVQFCALLFFIGVSLSHRSFLLLCACAVISPYHLLEGGSPQCHTKTRRKGRNI